MLIMCRELYGNSEYVYYGAEVMKGLQYWPKITVFDDRDIYFNSSTDPDLKDLEWKEVEKD